ncbi:MAG: efflux RND transporter periplasmic adaptor subunit, partial [Polyangiaceae bacterium]|nr:efflux RND transporter periplasmic adaptor subunit [Polyangiaceae bacterium]
RPGEAETRLSASGYVVARTRSIVAPKIPGRLAEVLVEEGERVQEGQLLARLDDEDARAALAQQTALARAAEAHLAAAGAAQAQAELDLSRAEPLVESGALAVAELDTARTRSDAAVAQAVAARADLAAAEAGIEAARLRLEQTEIRAPFDGTIVRKLADIGAVLAPATISEIDVGGIVEMVDLDTLEVEAEVSEEELPRIREGQPALIFLDAYPDRVIRGTASAVRPSIDRSKATAVVKVRFAEPAAGALPNMGARVSFLERPVDPVALRDEPRLRVPASAVVERDGADVVFVVDGDRVRRVPVGVAARVGAEVALSSGPQPGARVVAAPRPGLRDGARVRVAQASS